ncbi:hypothetical protein FJZ33_07800 [Candidatus Poribacteria bacterium]|nr:hypothetical protein [Candidatus Poribacteria bacterium]
MLSGEVMINGKLSGDIRKLRTGSILDKIRAISGEIFVPDEGIKVGAADHIITNPNRIDAKFQKGLLNLNSFRLVDKSPLNGNNSSISAFGEWNIDGDKFFDATVNLDMGFISEIIRKPDYLRGLLSFRVEARGKTIKCNWPLASTQVSKTPQKLVVGQATIDRFEGAVTYQNQEIKVDRIRVSSGDNLVIVNGNVPTAGKKMELRIDGRLNDMSILSFLNKDITESSGIGVVGVTITGDLKKVLAKEEPLRFLGSCSFNALNVNFPNSFITFKDLKADLVFDSQGISEKRGFIRLNSFRGRLNDGDFALDLDRSVRPGAEIIWSKDTDYRLNQINDIWVNLRDVRLYQPMVYSILLDGDVVLRGKLDAPILAGNVILDEGEYTESLESFIQKLFYSRQIGVKAFLDYPLVQELELNINVQVPNNMWMKNSLVNVEAKAAANVRGSLAKPIVLAQGNIIQGEFSYIGRKFTITKGEIRNENEINPRYDIVAETEVENTINPEAQSSILKVQMELKGSLSEPLPPNFSATGGGLVQGNTEISQTDIISLLTLGTTPQNFIDRGISGSSPLLLESAKWYIESQAEKRLNLKDVSLQIDLTNSRETRLAVTRQLIQDISVLMDVGYGEQQIGLEWEINKHLAFTGRTTPKKKEWGFDLKLKQDFP